MRSTAVIALLKCFRIVTGRSRRDAELSYNRRSLLRLVAGSLAVTSCTESAPRAHGPRVDSPASRSTSPVPTSFSSTATVIPKFPSEPVDIDVLDSVAASTRQITRPVAAQNSFTIVMAPSTSTAGTVGALQLPPEISASRHRSLIPMGVSDAERVQVWRDQNWATNFAIASVPLSGVQWGGRERDAAHPIDFPGFVGIPTADTFITDREPVVVVTVENDSRAYPLQILLWHQVVNDVVGGNPVAITYCPFSNSSAVFDRRVLGASLRFGVSGNLWRSNLLLWDTATESWWQQSTGKAVVGDLMDVRLSARPSLLVSYVDFKQWFPNGKVLSIATGVSGPYGITGYPGYDRQDSPSPLFGAKTDSRLSAKQRVLTMELKGEAVAIDFDLLAKEHVVNTVVADRPIVAFWKPGTVSALDKLNISTSRDVGAAVAHGSRIAGRTLTFESAGGQFRDRETGSIWDLRGRSTTGPLAGQQLSSIVHGNHLWFAWVAIHARTRLLS